MNHSGRPPLLRNWWVIWFALLAGLPMFYFFLAPQSIDGAGNRGSLGGNSNVWFIGLVPLAISMIIRWAVLPRMQSPQAAQPVFIIGIALSELCCFLGTFLFPNARNELFAASALGMLQYAPFLRRPVLS